MWETASQLEIKTHRKYSFEERSSIKKIQGELYLHRACLEGKHRAKSRLLEPGAFIIDRAESRRLLTSISGDARLRAFIAWVLYRLHEKAGIHGASDDCSSLRQF